MVALAIQCKKAPSGETTDMELTSDSTVGDVAAKIAAAEGCDLSQVVLIHNGIILSKGPAARRKTLEDAVGAAASGRLMLAYIISKKAVVVPATLTMQIHVLTLSAETPIPINTDPLTTVGAFREQVKDALPVDCANCTAVRLILRGTVLSNNERTLKAAGLADRDSLVAIADVGCVPAPCRELLVNKQCIEQIMRSVMQSGHNTGANKNLELMGEGGAVVRDIINDDELQTALSNHHVLNVFKAMLDAPETAHLALCDPHVGPLLRRLSAIANANGMA